jgi:hypothetical protein
MGLVWSHSLTMCGRRMAAGTSRWMNLIAAGIE